MNATESDQKLRALAEAAGMDVFDMLEEATYDGVAWGICTSPDCDYTTEVEPDQDAGWCEVCGTPTVKSCLRLAGLI